MSASSPTLVAPASASRRNAKARGRCCRSTRATAPSSESRQRDGLHGVRAARAEGVALSRGTKAKAATKFAYYLKTQDGKPTPIFQVTMSLSVGGVGMVKEDVTFVGAPMLSREAALAVMRVVSRSRGHGHAARRHRAARRHELPDPVGLGHGLHADSAERAVPTHVRQHDEPSFSLTGADSRRM